MLNSLKLKTTNLQSAPFDCNGNVVQIANTLLALIKICTQIKIHLTQSRMTFNTSVPQSQF